MKTKFTFIILLASLTAALAQYQQPPPQINVSGSAEIKVVPDEIRLSVAVESRNAALDAARLDNDTKIAAALAFLKQAGMPDRDVKTDFISVQPDYDRDRSRVTPVAYIIRKSIEIRLTNTVVFQSVVTGLLTNGVNVMITWISAPRNCASIATRRACWPSAPPRKRPRHSPMNSG